MFHEVTSALDPERVGKVLDTLRCLKASGMTMIGVTHDTPWRARAATAWPASTVAACAKGGGAKQVTCEPREERTRLCLQRVLN